MENKSPFVNLTQLIVQDRRLSFTVLSYISILAFFINLNSAQSPLIGVATSSIYLLINATFIGDALFESEKLLIKFLLGNLLLIVFLGLVGWTVMLLYNLDSLRSTLVLCIVTAFASLLNKRRSQQRNVGK